MRRVKIDRKDAVKLANYGLDRWLTLPRYIPEKDTRLLLKNCYHQYRQYSNVQTVLKNNLITLLDTVFPNVNRPFSIRILGEESKRWEDFVAKFWHCRYISEKSEKIFTNQYQRWCRKHGYNFSEAKVHTIHTEASGHIDILPKSETTKLLVEQSVSQLRATSAALAALNKHWGFLTVGQTLRPQLIAKIGDVRHFYSKKLLMVHAGLDAPPNDSGDVTGKHKSMRKVGASSLLQTPFFVMSVYLQNAPLDEAVYQFINSNRAESKPYRVYMIASANKFPCRSTTLL